MFGSNEKFRQLKIELEDEKLQSEVLWEYLKLAYENLDDREHVIIIPGTQISLGTIITASILGYQSRKKLIEDGTYEWDEGN